MAQGRPSPPSTWEYLPVASSGDADFWSAGRRRNRIRCESLRTESRASSRDVSDPTSGTGTLTPGSVTGVAHVPAACLRSCDGLRTPMSRTIDSGSNRKMHETMRRAIRHDSLPIVSGDDAGDVTVDLASHLSPWLLREHSPIALWIFMRCSAASTLSAGAPTVRPARPAGVDAALRTAESANTRWPRFRSPLTAPGTRRMFETSRSCPRGTPPHRPMWSASE